MIERFWSALAWRLPRGLVYWCAIRVAVAGCVGPPDARTCGDALSDWLVASEGRP